MIEIIKDSKGNLSAQATKDSSVVYVCNRHFEGFALKYKVDNTVYYQHLLLSVRAGAHIYFNAAKALYQHLKKNKLTISSFRKLAVQS